MPALWGDFPFSHFDGITYLKNNRDVAQSVLSGLVTSALEHYRRHGRAEGRSCTLAYELEPNQGDITSIFDGAAYLEAYPDVADAVRAGKLRSALDHYLRHGRKDGRTVQITTDGRSSLGSRVDLARLDAALESRAAIAALKAQLAKEAAGQNSRLDKVETTLPRFASNTELSIIRVESRMADNKVSGLRKDLSQLEQTTLKELNTLNEKFSRTIESHESRDHALIAQIQSLESRLTDMQHRLLSAIRSDDIARTQLEALQSQLGKEIDNTLVREHALLNHLEALHATLIKTQEKLSTAIQPSDLSHLREEFSQAIEMALKKIAAVSTTGELRERHLFGEMGSIRAELASAINNIADAARSTDLEHLRQHAIQELDRIHNELGALKLGLVHAQQAVSTAAHTSDVDRMKRDAAREFDRIRGDIASTLSMREAREQAVQEQIELLRISLDETQRRLAGVAREEDVDRLRRDAAQNIERLRNELAAISALDQAREQALLARIDALKAEINTAAVRAQMVEVKVDSVQRDLSVETREVAESLQESAATLDKLQKDLAEHNAQRESKETVIRSELELVKHELSVAQATSGASPGKSWSQLGQDLWVIEQCGYRKGGYFVDIGATDGVLLNNTYLLEAHYNWNGVCIEPDPAAYGSLVHNRKVHCSNACVWSSSGEELDFILAKEYGAVAAIADRDNHAAKREAYRTVGETIKVMTTSLNDLLAGAGAPAQIDYVSLDTEGSEYEILRTFDFDRWKVSLWTIEHNYAEQREHIYNLMTARGYKRREAQFDDWYYL